MKQPKIKLRSNSNQRRWRQFCHFRRRVLERFGIEITVEDHNKIREQIRCKSALLVEKVSNTRFKHRIRWKDIEMIVIYDKSRWQLVTAYPPTNP